MRQLASADSDISRMKRVIASLPTVPADKQPLNERVATLIRTLRTSEAEHRVVIQTTVGGTSNSTDRKTVSSMATPLEGLGEIASVPVRVEGIFLTRDGLEQFLVSGNRTGASLSALAVEDNRFKATFTLYGKL